MKFKEKNLYILWTFVQEMQLKLESISAITLYVTHLYVQSDIYLVVRKLGSVKLEVGTP